jgi:hypothetical protein
MLAIYFDPKNSAPLSLSSLVTFIPGTNWVEPEAWEKVQSHPILKMWIDAGELREIKRKDPKSSDESITAFSESDAILLAGGEYETAKLRKWLEVEDRKGVLAAIASRIAQLQHLNAPESFREHGHGLRESKEAWSYLVGPRASAKAASKKLALAE